MSMEDDWFAAGYLIATANIMHLHGEDTVAEDVLRELGATEGIIKRLDLCDYDAKVLRRLFRILSRRDRSAIAMEARRAEMRSSSVRSTTARAEGIAQ